MHTKERSCKDTVRMWPSTSQGKRLQPEANLQTALIFGHIGLGWSLKLLEPLQGKRGRPLDELIGWRTLGEDGSRYCKGMSINQGKARIAGSHQKVKRRFEQKLPEGLRKEATLLAPSFWVSSLWHCEKINFCCSKCPSAW